MDWLDTYIVLKSKYIGGNEFNALSKVLFIFREYALESAVAVASLSLLYTSVLRLKGRIFAQHTKFGMVETCLIPRLKKENQFVQV